MYGELTWHLEDKTKKCGSSERHNKLTVTPDRQSYFLQTAKTKTRHSTSQILQTSLLRIYNSAFSAWQKAEMHPKRGAAARQPLQIGILKKKICRQDDTKYFVWFTLQPKSTIEFDWWLILEFEKINKLTMFYMKLKIIRLDLLV
jgi:hypothetical protein